MTRFQVYIFFDFEAESSQLPVIQQLTAKKLKERD